MKHLIKKENNILHGTIGWSHNGKDGQYCEAGETVKIKWQPTAGWGLKEVHYTDAGGNVVAIEGGEFVMPDSAVVIGATFKRFFLNDWANDPYKPTPQTRHLQFTAGEGGASVGFYVNTQGYNVPQEYVKPKLQYSIDGGKTWQDYDLQFSEDGSEAVAVELAAGDNVMFKGVNDYVSYYLASDDDGIVLQAYIEGEVAASGDVTSLLNEEGGDVALTSYAFAYMFKDCTGLTTAPSLPATTLAEYCYNGMFSGCTGLTTAPALPATTLANGCYGGMFSGCTGLTTAPSLPATTLAESCYNNMFSGCTGLTTAPSLPATTLADSCYSSMFNGCTGLTTAPSLPATTLAESCYSSMFRGCTGLTQAPSLPATTLAGYCYFSMFYGCTGITSHDVATLNNSKSTFQSNTSCASLTIHAETPPTIANDTITGLKADCIIYVPAASVDAYKAARYWSARAAYIQAIQ